MLFKTLFGCVSASFALTRMQFTARSSLVFLHRVMDSPPPHTQLSNTTQHNEETCTVYFPQASPDVESSDDENLDAEARLSARRPKRQISLQRASSVHPRSISCCSFKDGRAVSSPALDSPGTSACFDAERPSVYSFRTIDPSVATLLYQLVAFHEVYGS